MHFLEVGFQISKFHEESSEFSVIRVLDSCKCNKTFNFFFLKGGGRGIAPLAPLLGVPLILGDCKNYSLLGEIGQTWYHLKRNHFL